MSQLRPLREVCLVGILGGLSSLTGMTQIWGHLFRFLDVVWGCLELWQQPSNDCAGNIG